MPPLARNLARRMPGEGPTRSRPKELRSLPPAVAQPLAAALAAAVPGHLLIVVLLACNAGRGNSPTCASDATCDAGCLSGSCTTCRHLANLLKLTPCTTSSTKFDLVSNHEQDHTDLLVRLSQHLPIWQLRHLHGQAEKESMHL